MCSMRAVVDIIVPVYRGYQDTRRCLESVLNYSQQTPFDIVVIDDASPEDEVAEYVRDLARASDRILLLRNDTNQGFVASVNRGMSLHPDRDVVILNSDTEVANNWLDRLYLCVNKKLYQLYLHPLDVLKQYLNQYLLMQVYHLMIYVLHLQKLHQ